MPSLGNTEATSERLVHEILTLGRSAPDRFLRRSCANIPQTTCLPSTCRDLWKQIAKTHRVEKTDTEHERSPAPDSFRHSSQIWATKTVGRQISPEISEQSQRN